MRHPWTLLVLAVLLGCGGEGHDNPAAPGRPLFASNDLKGDTLASANAQERAQDVLHLEAVRADQSLLVTVRFVQVVQPHSSGASNAMLGSIDIDIDDDPHTGLSAIADGFGATTRFDGTTVTAIVPLALLGSAPAARVRMVGAVGSVERVSDIVPNEGSVLVEMP